MPELPALLLLLFSLPFASGLRTVPSATDGSDGPKCESHHLIHIGKTGGTFVRVWLPHLYGQSLLDERRIQLHGHNFKLGEGGPNDCYFLFVRDPVERWVSGWISAFRKGCPYYCRNWNKQEEWVFDNWKTPSAMAEDLAEDLEYTFPLDRETAIKGHQSLEHTKHGFAHYLPNLTLHLPRIVFVGRTNELESDFPRLCRQLGLPEPSNKTLPPMHTNPPEMEWMKAISEKAEEALRQFLAEDYRIMDVLRGAGLLSSTQLQRQTCLRGQGSCVFKAAGRFWHENGARVRNASRLEDFFDVASAHWNAEEAELAMSGEEYEEK